MKTYKTTKKDFAEFKKWVNYYLNKYGLNDSTVYFRHEKISGGVATCTSQITARCLTFTLATDSACCSRSELDIKSTARHEVIHALIADLTHLVGSFCSEDEWRKADEALVCRLTNLLK